MTLPAAFRKRFVVVSGKGGVGKSTLAAALALRNAEEGRRTCVLQFNTKDAISHHFPGAPPATYTPTRLDPTLPLWTIDLQPGPALREYGLMKLRFSALHRLVFENDVMRRLLAMIPGMTETFLLGKAWFMEAMERDETGAPRWDTLIVDAPATGHGVSLLRLPEVLLSIVPVGPMADDARQMAALLRDPARTAMHIATLPAELPVHEALELERAARETIGIPSGWMLANMVQPWPLSPQQLARLRPLREAKLAGLAAEARDNVEAALASCALQHQWLTRLEAETAMPVARLPQLVDPVGAAGLGAIADALVAAVAAGTRLDGGARGDGGANYEGAA